MSFIDRAFSIHDDAMMLRSQRSSILAGNIANADTPHYKARDIDFHAMLQQIETQQEQGGLALSTTHADHLNPADNSDTDGLYYRNPLQPSLDGNTVDVHAEQARFSENALMYQTSLTFLNSKIRGLQLAIKGQ